MKRQLQINLLATLMLAACAACASSAHREPESAPATDVSSPDLPAGGAPAKVEPAPLSPEKQVVADERKAEISEVWNDPGFQKQFVGTYGVNAEVEPRLTPEDVAVLEKVRPLMGENLPQAETVLRALIKPESSATLDFTLGGIFFQQDKLDDALASFQKAVTKFPSFRRAWRNLGLIHVRATRYAEAIRAFTKMIEHGGGDGYSYGLLGFAYAAKEDFQPAEAAYRNALLLQPESTDWRLGLTRCVFKQKKYEDAATLLDALLEKYPEKADFWLLQAHTYLGMKQPLKAAENLEMVDRLGKSTVDSLFTLGDIYVAENLMPLAARAYGRALSVDTRQPLARSLRSAETLASRGAMTEASEVSAHIKEVRGKDIEETDRRRMLKLDARLAMARGASSEETAAVLEEIVKLDPLDGEALMLLGQYYSKANQPDRAMLAYEHAESIDAFEADAKVRRAQVLVSLQRYGDAVPLLRRAQEVRPRENIARYLEQVEKVSKTAKR